MVSVAAGADDPNAPRFEENRTILEGALDARGRRIEVMDGPVNAWVDLEGIGPTVIPYMNHYLVNGAVIVPLGGVPADGRDRAAGESVSGPRGGRRARGADLVRGRGAALHHAAGSRGNPRQVRLRWKHERSPV